MPTIIEDLTGVFRHVFDNPTMTISPEMTANEVEGWDSFSHVNLIMAIEMKFGITFKQKEIYGFSKVGDMLNCIEQKVAARS